MKVVLDEKTNSLVVTIPLERPTLSKSGATYVVASTRGNLNTGVIVKNPQGHDREVVLGLNAYIRM